MKTAALYGAGRKSMLAERVLRRYLPDVHVKYLVENRIFQKLGAKVLEDAGEQMTVISPEKLRKLHAGGECDCVIVPAAYSISDLREIREWCVSAGIAAPDLFAMPFTCVMAPLESPRDAGRILVQYDDLAHIMHLDIHVVDHCNYRCRACGHFSNLVREDVVYDAKAIDASLARLAKIVPDICELSILGGEPLLHPEIDVIPGIVRKYFPHSSIDMITNGALLDKAPDSLFASLKANNIVTFVSLYPPMYERLDALVDMFNSRGVRYTIARCEAFDRRLVPSPLFEKTVGLKKCGHDMCLRGTRVGYCVIALFTDYYNKYAGKNVLPEDKGVDVFSYDSGKEFIAALHQPLELCRQCVACDAGKQYYKAWDIMNKDCGNDWFIDFPFAKATAHEAGE